MPKQEAGNRTACRLRWRKLWRSSGKRWADLRRPSRPRLLWIVPGLLAAGLILPGTALAGKAREADSAHACLLVVANRLSLQDSSEPHFAAYLRESASALISPACLGGRSEAAVYATASAGAYSRGSAEYGLLLNWNERYEEDSAANVHLRRIGPPLATSGIVHLGLPAVVSANRRVNNPPSVWLLGQTLRDAHILRVAYGNSDNGESLSRMGAGLLSDSHGVISAGDVGPDTLKADPSAAGGVVTNLPGLRDDVLSALDTGAVVEVEFGDLNRIEDERGSFTAPAYLAARKAAVARLFTWLQEIRKARPDAPILVVSLAPPLSDEGRWDSLGLMLASGERYGEGLLASNTTRTPGIISSVDVGATVLDAARTPRPQAMIGYPARAASFAGAPLDQLRRWDLIVRLNEDLQFAILLGLGLLAGAAAVVATWFLVKAPDSKTWGRGAILALAIIAWIPVIFLVPLDHPEWFAAVAPAVVVSLGVGAALGERGRFAPLQIPAIVMLAGVAASALGVSDLVKMSALSSWQLTGLRFYGVGNEFMGCVIGAASVIPMWEAGRRNVKAPPELLAGWFVFWGLIIALPAFGANLGGAIAATVSFGLVFRALTGRAVTPLTAAVTLAAGLAVAVALTATDALVSGPNPTHMGMAARSITHGNGGYLLAAIQRKAVMNVGLWSRPETRITVVIFAVVLGLWLRYRDRLKAASKLPATISQGLTGLFYGGVAALLFNDSGIVSVAFILIYVMGWYLWDLVTLRTGIAFRTRTRHASARS